MAPSFAVFTLMLISCYSVDGARILLTPFLNASHFMQMDALGQPLIKRGHEVYLLMQEKLLVKSPGYKIITYKESTINLLDPERQIGLMNAELGRNELSMMFSSMKIICAAMLSDPELFPKLESLKFDLIVVDNFMLNCIFLIPHKLGVPFVSFGAILTSWHARLPTIPSVIEPGIYLDFFGIQYCDESKPQWSIVRRVCRIASHVMENLFVEQADEEHLKQYADFSTIRELREKASLFLFNREFQLSSPVPKLPNVEYVGGMTAGPAKPLDKELREWMDKSANVVVVSFGSRFPSLPYATAVKFFASFGSLTQYRFLFRFKKLDMNQGIEIPSNVRIMDWLPQNDVLAHNSTRLFITHSGMNGLYEALYHGVPMLCVYVGPDQHANARHIMFRGFGLMASIFEFTSEQLTANIVELISNESYSIKIKHASRIFLSEKHPAERAADAVERLLKYGGEHLRSKEAYELKWWQFYMLDIFAILYVFALILIAVAYKLLSCVLRCVCKRCCKSSAKSKTD